MMSPLPKPLRRVLRNTLICGLFSMSNTLNALDPVKIPDNLTLKQKIGQMIVVGFHGESPTDIQVKALSSYAQQGLIGGVIYFAYNLKSPTQVKALTTHFKGLQTPIPLLQCVDQEGGRVQRLSTKNGFTDTPSALDIASKMTIDEAKGEYEDMAQMVSGAGFNCVFGPVVDLHVNPFEAPEAQKPNPVIGGLKRAFSANPDDIVVYAQTFIEAHGEQGILTAVKHFPGHGLAPSDTHHDLTDITKTYQPELELKPYEALAKSEHVDMVMTAHVVHRDLDPEHPATLSPVVIKTLLRERIGYDGVVVTDDLFMGAIQKHYNLRDIVIRAIQADVDILLFSINHAAQKGVNADEIKPIDGKVVEDIIEIVLDAIEKGEISEERIQKSYERIATMKLDALKS